MSINGWFLYPTLKLENGNFSQLTLKDVQLITCKELPFIECNEMAMRMFSMGLCIEDGWNKTLILEFFTDLLEVENERCNKISWHFFLSSITKELDHLFFSILKGWNVMQIQIAELWFFSCIYFHHCPLENWKSYETWNQCKSYQVMNAFE